MLQAIDSGEIDLGVGFVPEVRRWHARQLLCRESHLCLFDPALVPVPAPVSIEDFVAFPHVVPSLRSETVSFVDEALAALGRARRVVAATTEFLAIPIMPKEVPLIATLPARLAACCARGLALTTSVLPVAPAGFDVAMVWHRRDTGSPAHAWLHSRLAAVDAEGRASAAPGRRGRPDG